MGVKPMGECGRIWLTRVMIGSSKCVPSSCAALAIDAAESLATAA